MTEAVAEAEGSLPEVITVIPKGMSPQQTTEVMQGVVANSILGVRRERERETRCVIIQRVLLLTINP